MPNSILENTSLWKVIWSGLCLMVGGVASSAFFLGKQEITIKSMKKDIDLNTEKIKGMTPITWCETMQASCKAHQISEFGHGAKKFLAMEQSIRDLSKEISNIKVQSKEQHQDLKDFISNKLDKK